MKFLQKFFSRTRRGSSVEPARRSITPTVTELTLRDYRTLIRTLPVPTIAQMEDFADFIFCTACSYTHFPIFPPGDPFQIFLNPAAGMQIMANSSGEVVAVPRQEQGLHFTWLPTAMYQDRFGVLAFSRVSGNSASLQLVEGYQLIEPDDLPFVHNLTTKTAFKLPDEVIRTGRVMLSGIGKPLASDYGIWQKYIINSSTQLDWPEESGGQETIRKIRDRCLVLQKDPSSLEKPIFDDECLKHYTASARVDLQIYNLLEPERLRQREWLVTAIRQVVDLLTTDSD